MDLLNPLLEALSGWLPLIGVAVIVVLGLLVINTVLRRRWKGSPDLQFRFQLIMLGLTLSGVLLLILAMPISDTLRGQLLSLLGILLSASIALASTTFIGNMMAGIMLRLIQNARPGDFVSVADISGRITEMDLLHTELQTEDRDLVTVPNLLMVTQPLRRVRASGTIVSAEVSLGYDVPRKRIVEVLRKAAADAGLGESFVQVRGLGDFSVLYRVAGLLADTKHLISARSDLREAMLDALHEAGIEIVSPTFMNTKVRQPDEKVIPQVSSAAKEIQRVKAESVAFDKAEEAASVEGLRDNLRGLDSAIESAEGEQLEALKAQRVQLKARVEQAELLQKQLAENDRKGSAEPPAGIGDSPGESPGESESEGEGEGEKSGVR